MTSIEPPAIAPAKGYYYHYKHRLDDHIGYRAIEVLGVSVNTEDAVKFSVIFRPLYESPAYRAGKLLEDRPLLDWMSPVGVGGTSELRYRLIEDPQIIQQLDSIRLKLYGQDR